ncbi:PRD domain-containing protein [Streptobacillus ratti]|uniref:PRD domain-containing protein n=1 Tax=Streptobacillus ratti TaxID=1720557 RepID=UPI0009324406|nr:PRD domain-containing protein [Streptobacillus ratti]
MEKLKVRIDILKQAGIINEEMFYKILKVIDMFKEKYNITLNEENASMFITHLAMLLKRMKNNEEINALEDDELEELKNFSSYDMAKEIYFSIEEILGEKIAENEYGFMITHLITLLGGN